MPGEERKLVSVLFVDMVGSTARLHGADPEDIRDLLRRFHEPVRNEIELHDGVLEKLIGDAVVAVFGARRAHGDDAARAVRCALRIVSAIEELNRNEPALQLAVRAGIATGEALVELGTDPAGGDAVAIGEVLNLAARLQAAAPPGGVLVSDETVRATRRLIKYGKLAPVEAKGFPEPQPAWRAIAEVSIAVAKAPLVGRDAELHQLKAALAETRASKRPQVFTVLGPPGIGKSRLAAEFGAWARSAGAATYYGRCLPYAERRPYQASIDQVKGAAGIFEADAPTAAREKLADLLSRTLGSEDSKALTGPLSVMLALGTDEPIDRAQQLHFATRRLLEGLSAEQPAVFVFDDVHLADDGQFELLEYLRDRLGHAMAMLLVLARPELAQIRERWCAVKEGVIALDPLADEAAAELASELLDSDGAGRDLTDLLTTAGGNPLFLEELTASIREGGAGSRRLPVTVREAIAAHIDALPGSQRSLLLDASVIGDTFWRGVLAAISSRTENDVRDGLDELAEQGLLRRAAVSRVEHDVQFSFKHVLVHEVAYGTLTRVDRQTRHRAVATYVEARVGPQNRDLAGFLAYHWRAAGDQGKAIEHLLVAADSAQDVFAANEMKSNYAAAIELAGLDPLVRRHIELRQALALVRVGDYAAAAMALDALIPELSGRDEVEAVIARVNCAYWMEDTEASVRFAAQGRTLAEQLGDRELLAVAALHEGMPHEYTGDPERMREAFDRARRLWPVGARQLEWAMLNEHDADSRYWTGDYIVAEQLAREAHEMGGEVHQLSALLRGGGWRGLCVAAQGRSEEALAWLDQIFKMAQELDSRWGAATLNYESLPLRDMLRLKEARACNEHALELVNKRGAWGMPELQAEIDLCVTDLMEGNAGRVERDLPKLWDAAINGKAWRPWLGGLRLALVRAELARQTQDSGGAIRESQDALDRAIRGRRPKYEASARSLLGTALMRRGEVREGVAELRSAVAIADVLGSPTPRWQLRVNLTDGLYATGDDAGAERVTREAATIIGDYARGLSERNTAWFLEADPVATVMKAAGPLR